MRRLSKVSIIAVIGGILGCFGMDGFYPLGFAPGEGMYEKLYAQVP